MPPVSRILRKQQLIATTSVVLALLLVTAFTSPIPRGASSATIVPSVDPNSVVPTEFRADMSWSEEGGWHWVTISYDGTQRYTGSNYDYSIGKQLLQVTYVATMVRTLAATDSCADCIRVSNDEEGPPVILGGPDNPSLTAAYAQLDNGPRKVIQSANPRVKRWTNGSWYLNYSPITHTFFSWTWIPDDGGFVGAKTNGETATLPTPSLDASGQVGSTQSDGSSARDFPIIGSYVISQDYGCVPLNAGYPSPSFCPSDRPSFHSGIDLAADTGTPILAAASGSVTFSGIDSSNTAGNSMIVIQHNGANGGYSTVYMHWARSFVEVGQRVNAGQIIAEVGSVGYSTGPHLHFSVVVSSNNQTVDPLSWLAGSAQLAHAFPANESNYSGVLQWKSLIDQAAEANGVPSALTAAIMAIESGGDPNAVSPAGALGLMQMMPDELRRLGVPQDQWTDPASNVDAAARYLAELLGTGQSVQEVIGHYFGSGCDVLGTCTQDYVERVMTLYVGFTNWMDSGHAP